VRYSDEVRAYQRRANLALEHRWGGKLPQRFRYTLPRAKAALEAQKRSDAEHAQRVEEAGHARFLKHLKVAIERGEFWAMMPKQVDL
jgi:hypothetical protein